MKPPTREAGSLWINAILYAVTGRMAEADGIIATHRDQVWSMARFLSKKFPFQTKPLWRGLLLDPGEVRPGFPLRPRDTDRFYSFSEDRDVATWFADPASVMGGMVHLIRPRAQGWLAHRVEPRPVEILFHWRWVIPLKGLGVDLIGFARQHPELEEVADQFRWNVETQQEVIARPTGLDLEPWTHDRARTQELDKRLTFPEVAKELGL